MEFNDQFTITRFGLPNALMFDNAYYFLGNNMTDFNLKRGFKLNTLLTNPQGNGLAESKYKNIIRIIKRTIDQNKKNWHKYLTFSLWVDRITQKASIGTFPFHMVYGKEAVIPSNLVLSSLALIQFIDEVLLLPYN